MKKFFSALLITVLMVLALVACSNETGKDDKLKIVTSVFPIYDWTVNITAGVSNVEVTMLVQNGTDLHSYQPSAADLLTILECDVFIYVGGESDKWVAEVLENSPNPDRIVINLMDILGADAKLEETIEGMESAEEEEEEEEYDEHVWLSLRNAQKFVKKIADELEKKDADNASAYGKNAAAYKTKLEDLDKKYVETLANTDLNTLIFADRFPFRYLLDDYKLSYYAAFSGCSADTEASFQTVTFLASKMDELGLPVVLRIDGSSDKLAETVVAATNSKKQKILMLDSLQSVSSFDVQKGTTYLGTMEKNLTVIKEALTATATSPTPTATDSPAPATPTPTEEPTPTAEPTATEEPTPTAEPTATEEPTPTVEPTATEEPTPTAEPTATETPTPTATQAPTATDKPTNTPSPTLTPTPTKAPTATSKPTNTPTNTLTPTPTKAPTATNKPTEKPTPTPTVAPTATNTPAPTATNTPVPTATNTPTPTPTPEAGISFTNATIEAAVRSALGKQSGSISKLDAEKITSLDLTNKGITSIADLAYFKNLRSLKLDTNKIQDFSVLAGLTNLEELSAGETGLKDLSVLKGLTKLKRLWLFSNGITDISSLSGLTGLTELDLNYNSITNLSPLKSLTSLSILNLTQNGISDISALSAIASNLDSLWLGFNNISNISALSGAKKAAYINLAANKVSDWSPVSHVSTVAGRP